MSSRRKVINTWNERDGLGVKYESTDGKVMVDHVDTKWFFGIMNYERQNAEAVLKPYRYRFGTDPRFPDYTMVITSDVYEDDYRQERKKIVLALENAGIQTFEGDLLNDKRWYIDREVEISDKFRKIYFDIETDDTLEKIEIGRDRILSFAGVDDEGREVFHTLKAHTDEEEAKLLRKMVKVLEDYDIVLGWNIGTSAFKNFSGDYNGFDFPYVIKRMEVHGLGKEINGVLKRMAKFDLLKRFRHIFRFDTHIKSFSLEYVSQHFLGKGKIKHDEKIIELWTNNVKKLREYNLEDCKLVKELDEKMGVSAMMIRQSQWCGVPPSKFGLYSIIDAYILKVAHRIGKMCPTSKKALQERDLDHDVGSQSQEDTSKKKRGAQYTGAIVLDPVVGKYDRVYTFDFKSLYPSMMRTSNIGYDSLLYEPSEDCITNPGTLVIPRKSGPVIPTYFKKELSVVNLAVTDLLKKRTEYKKLKLKMIEEGTNKGPTWEMVVSDEIIVKELANSTYGIMGLAYGRYFSVDVAESITLFGQWVITFAQRFFKETGHPVIYGDTDSVFVSTGKELLDVQKTLDEFHVALKRELREVYNIPDCYIELAFDKQYESFILVAKKTYAGHVVNIEGKKTDDTYGRGLDYIKKSTFTFAAVKQRVLLDKILKERMDSAAALQWYRDTRKEFDSREFSREELTLTQKVSQNPTKYKGTPPLHARLAGAVMERTGENLVNTEVDYIVTSHDKKMQGVLASEWTGEFDRDYYWENRTENVLLRVLEVCYPDTDFSLSPQLKLL